MFGCFSKKKKLTPSPPHPDKITTEPTAALESGEESLPPPLTVPPTKTLKKSKFCPIEPANHAKTPPEFTSSSLTAIDRMLEEGLQEASLPYAQENTGHFVDLPEQPPTSHFFPIVPLEPANNTFNIMGFQDTHSQSIEMDYCGQEDIDDEQHFIPKLTLDEVHTLEELTERSTNEKNRRKPRRSSRLTSSRSSSRQEAVPPQELPEERSGRQFAGYDATVEQWALDTTITLQNFKICPQRIQQKIGEELEEADLMEETLEQAENSFYSGTLEEEFTRATLSSDFPALARRIFAKMTPSEKNAPNLKGYAPVQLLVLKTIRNEGFLELAKSVIYDPEVALECRGPTGWTPLQQALFYRNIPLVTHLFKASYAKKQAQFTTALASLTRMLQQLPDFELQMEVKVDSFLPLVGSLAPSDTLVLLKRGGRLRLKYSLVGYEFPSCKRREMEIVFDGSTLWGVNVSKGTCCDLLQALEHEEMILMIEDMLTGEMRRGWPIVHSASLTKALSLFQNEISAELAGTHAVKHLLQLCYTSTAEKRRSQVTTPEELAFLGSYAQFQQRRESLTIKEKNRNKKVELELWLADGFGLELPQLLQMLQVLSMGNNFIAEWSKFFKNEVGALVQKSGLFPVKIDIPLSYSLFFNIEFQSYRPLPPTATDIALPEGIKRIARKEFQGTMLSKEKRSLFIQAYT